MLIHLASFSASCNSVQHIGYHCRDAIARSRELPQALWNAFGHQLDQLGWAWAVLLVILGKGNMATKNRVQASRGPVYRQRGPACFRDHCLQVYLPAPAYATSGPAALSFGFINPSTSLRGHTNLSLSYNPGIGITGHSTLLPAQQLLWEISSTRCCVVGTADAPYYPAEGPEV